MLDLGHQTTTEAADDKSDANTKPEQQQADARPPTGPPTVNLKPVALKDSDVEFPEGGIRAWLVVAGVCGR